MPLLIPVFLLVAVIAFSLLLWAVGLLRRPFLAPVARPVAAWQLGLRGSVLLAGLVPYVGIAAWLRPGSVRDVGIGLAVGLALGSAAALVARVERVAAGVVQRPNRAFVAGLALLVLARVAWSFVDGGVMGAPHDPRIAGLGAVLLGYAIAHAWVLRGRVRRALRTCVPDRQAAR